MEDSLEEVWLEGRRLLCPGCPAPAFRGVITRTVDVSPERAVRLWMRWKDMDGVHEREDWVPLLPGHRYQLRVSREPALAILPAQGDTALAHGLWTLPPVQYLHAGTYRFLLERDGDVRLRFSPEVADCSRDR